MMENKEKYRIFVTLPNQKQLVFTVDDFEINDGIITFYDSYKQKEKTFDMRNCEIERGMNNV